MLVATAQFLLTPLREGRPQPPKFEFPVFIFLLTPLREGRRSRCSQTEHRNRHFYSRPCGRGDAAGGITEAVTQSISTHAPAGGATAWTAKTDWAVTISTHAPAGGATTTGPRRATLSCYFYSRPCGRGDARAAAWSRCAGYFYSRPCGRGDGNFPQIRHEVLRQIAER